MEKLQKVYIQQQRQYIDTGVPTHYFDGKVIINDTGKLCVIGIVLCSIGLILIQFI